MYKIAKKYHIEFTHCWFPIVWVGFAEVKLFLQIMCLTGYTKVADYFSDEPAAEVAKENPAVEENDLPDYGDWDIFFLMLTNINRSSWLSPLVVQ